MNLEDRIRKSIWTYPSLYKAETLEKSRLLVLNHLFLVIGNGYVWVGNDYVEESEVKYKGKRKFNPTGKTGFRQLPDNFFEIRLFEIEFKGDGGYKGSVRELLDELEGTFHYSTRNGFGTTIHFQSDADTADQLAKRFGSWNIALEAKVAGKGKFSPYPVCEYSAITEIYEGKTCKLEGSKPIRVKADYVQGAIEVANAALAYYLDDDAVKANIHHPNTNIGWTTERFSHREESQGRVGVQKLREEWGFRKGETIKQYCHRIWKKHRKEQIAFLQKFLKKFN